MMLELMYGTIPSEKIPSLEMLPPVSVSTYPIIPPLPANDSANAVLSTPLIGMYVPTLDNTNSANTVAIFPGSFPLKKSPICTSPPPPPRPDDIARVAFGLVAASKTASNVPSSPTAASTIPNGSNNGHWFTCYHGLINITFARYHCAIDWNFFTRLYAHDGTFLDLFNRSFGKLKD